MDFAAFSDCGGGTKAYSLGNGQHTFQVRARHGGYFDHVPIVRTWTVDAIPPDTSIGGGPPAVTKLQTASFTLGSTQAGSTFFCSLDGAPAGLCSSPLNLSGLGLGTHLLVVTAVDPYGNVDATPATRSWRVDLVAPNTLLRGAPPASTRSRTATFRFASTEAGSRFQCKLDAKPWAACTTPKTYRNLRPGAHTFRVRATDAAGNTDGSPVVKRWTIRR
jgi:hypothetical protein